MFGCIKRISFSIGILAISALTAIDANSAAISCRDRFGVCSRDDSSIYQTVIGPWYNPTTLPARPPVIYGQTYITEQGRTPKKIDLCTSYYRSPQINPDLAPPGWQGAPAVIILHGGDGTPYGQWQKAWAKWFTARGYIALVPWYITPAAGLDYVWPTQCAGSDDLSIPPLGSYENCMNGPDGATDFVATYGTPPVDASQRKAWCTQWATNHVVAADGTHGWDAATREAQRNVQTLIRALKLNSAYFGVDPNRISVIGESFGGITALRTAMRADDFGEAGERHEPSMLSESTLSDPLAAATANQQLSKPWRVISIAGGECYPGMVQEYSRENVPLDWGNCQGQADEDDTPYLMFNGTGDTQALPEYAEATCVAGSAITANGAPVCAAIIPYDPVPQLPAGAVCPQRSGNNPVTRAPLGTAVGGDHYIAQCPWRSGVNADGSAAAVQTEHAISCWAEWFFRQEVAPPPSQIPQQCNASVPVITGPPW